ncbi:hypothetical protein C8Q80DRAFT_167630 [Daedaleopsis nitida]|nr:hypothetical protein C8Q80DRAFT_167630 [Daedaleopsis nitida]
MSPPPSFSRVFPALPKTFGTMSTLEITFAPRPFDNPTTDFILRASDGVHFRVRSQILAEASPVLSKLLMTSQTESEEPFETYVDNTPIVPIPQQSETIDRLLRLVYPTTDPILADIKDIRLVLAAAIEYEMEEATALLKNALLSHVEDQPCLPRSAR